MSAKRKLKNLGEEDAGDVIWSSQGVREGSEGLGNLVGLSWRWRKGRGGGWAMGEERRAWWWRGNGEAVG